MTTDLPLPKEDILTILEQSYIAKTIRVKEVECLVMKWDGYQVVAFRGTEFSDMLETNGFWDVIRDLRAIPWYDKRVGWSHAGFLKGARGVVDKGLYGLLRRDEPILVLGHSLGAALALNAAVMLESMGFMVDGVIGVGSPRTFLKGTAKKVRKYGLPVWEFCNHGDPVTHLPFSWWGFDHVNRIQIGDPEADLSISDNHMLSSYKETLC